MYKLTNLHTAPVGVFAADGSLVTVPVNGAVYANLTENEAAAIIRDSTILKCERVKAPSAPKDAAPPDGKQPPAAGKGDGKSGQAKKGGSAPAG